MALSQRAHTPLPALTYGNPPIAIQITCHIAVWYWAAQEAQGRGLTNAKAPEATLRRIVNMPGGPQGAMMAIPTGVALNFGAMPAPPLPAVGTVLRWATGATHSAVFTGPNAVLGYNQGTQFATAVGVPGYARCRLANLAPGHLVVSVIPEAAIVNAAGVVFNL
jgi:hypothetical protein